MLRYRIGRWSSLESDMRCSVCYRLIFEGWWLEYYALVVALAMALALDAIRADWTLFATLDASFAACQTSCLGTLPGQFGLQGSLRIGRISSLQLDLMVVVPGFEFGLHLGQNQHMTDSISTELPHCLMLLVVIRLKEATQHKSIFGYLDQEDVETK